MHSFAGSLVRGQSMGGKKTVYCVCRPNRNRLGKLQKKETEGKQPEGINNKVRIKLCVWEGFAAIPCGLVVRIRRSHRRGRGSIPRMGVSLFFFFFFFSFLNKCTKIVQCRKKARFQMQDSKPWKTYCKKLRESEYLKMRQVLCVSTHVNLHTSLRYMH